MSVTYTVQAAEPVHAVVLGAEGVRLDQRVTVHSGSVVANAASVGPYLADGVEMSVGQQATFATGSAVYGDSVTIGPRSVVPIVHHNGLQVGLNVTVGAEVTPLSLPVVELPAVAAASPGATNVTVGQTDSTTLQPGSYGALVAGPRATIVLTGGEYDFASWDLGQQVRVLVQAPSEVRIAGRLAVGPRSFVGPDPAMAGVGPSAIVIHVAGINGSDGLVGASPKAVTFGQQTELSANVYAPNGTLQVAERTTVRGALLGRWVDVGPQASLTLDTAFETPRV